MVKILDTQELIYNGNDLGAVYSKNNTIFKVWAPTVDKIAVVVYEFFNDTFGIKYPMTKVKKGIWELKINGDFKNKYYNYLVLNDGEEKVTPDIYTKGCSANGEKGMIVDFSSIKTLQLEKS